MKLYGNIVKLFVLIGIITLFSACMPADIKDITLDMPDISELADGTYPGTCETSLVSADVEVDLAESIMTDIRLTRHDNGRGEKAESVIEDVLEEQTIGVDTVSGATASSIVILKAIEDALIP